MIENDEQLRVSQDRLALLRRVVERLRHDHPDDNKFKEYADSPLGLIEKIEREIAEYLATREAAKVE